MPKRDVLDLSKTDGPMPVAPSAKDEEREAARDVQEMFGFGEGEVETSETWPHEKGGAPGEDPAAGPAAAADKQED